MGDAPHRSFFIVPLMNIRHHPTELRPTQVLVIMLHEIPLS